MKVFAARRAHAFMPVVLLALHASLLGWSAWRQSPTLDEIGHLPAGILVWQYGRFDLYRVNPPLVRAVAAVPVLLADAKTDWSRLSNAPGNRPEWAVGADLIVANGDRSFLLFALARWMCIPFSVLGGCICFAWAKSLYGESAGLLSLLLWCLSPEIVGNASLISTDAAAAALGASAVYAFHHWMTRHDWSSAFIAGVSLGLAELSKMSWILLFAILPVIACCCCAAKLRQGNFRAIGKWGGQLAAILLLAVYLVNLGYGFDGTCRALGRFDFISRALSGPTSSIRNSDQVGNRFAGTCLESVPVPFPADYVTGLDVQKRDFEKGGWSYLRGEYRHGGWRYYYLYALAVKMPLGTWLLAIVALIMTWARRSANNWRTLLPLLIPPAALFVVVSSETGFSRHFRYVLPVLPFLYVWISQVSQLWGPPGNSHGTHNKLPTGRQIGAIVAAIGLIWFVVSALSCFPHSLSYFNEIAGGPRHGHRHLVDSNVDWGQDLLFLRDWIKKNPDSRPSTVAYYGGFDQKVAGIDFPLTPAWVVAPRRESPVADRSAGPDAGWHAVSVNLLRDPSGRYGHFLKFEPVDSAGYSIHLYHLSPEQALALRRSWPPEPKLPL